MNANLPVKAEKKVLFAPWSRNLKRTTCFQRLASSVDRAASAAKGPFAKLEFQIAATDPTLLPLLYKNGEVLMEKTHRGKTVLIPRCYVCGKEATAVDHLRALDVYGDLKRNRAPICGNCNGKKGSKDPLDFLTEQTLESANITLATGDTLTDLRERMKTYLEALDKERNEALEVDPAPDDQQVAAVDRILRRHRASEHAHRLAIDYVLGHICVTDKERKEGVTKLAKAKRMLIERCGEDSTAMELFDSLAVGESLEKDFTLCRTSLDKHPDCFSEHSKKRESQEIIEAS